MPFELPSLSKEGPFYQPLTEQWQNQKCRQLAIEFSETFEQHTALTGTHLSKIIPYQSEKISMDGNCFFRCISKMISGTEVYHAKLRAEVCRYMVTDGKSTINRYLKTFSEKCCPVSYLNESVMTENGIWATDVEIMAISCLLDSDDYVATKYHDSKKLWLRTIWNRYCGRVNHPTENPEDVALYISNVNHNHYEPVTRLINSDYDSFMRHDSSKLTVAENSTVFVDVLDSETSYNYSSKFKIQ